MEKQIQVDLTKIKNVKCKCGNQFFERINVVKKIPGLMIGSTQDVMSPVEIYRCDLCKQVLPDFEKAIEEPKESTDPPASKLTISKK